MVSSVSVRIVPPDERSLVGSAGLSVVIFMYCACEGPARQSRSSAANTVVHGKRCMVPPGIRLTGRAGRDSMASLMVPLLQDRDEVLERSLRGRAPDVVDAQGSFSPRSPRPSLFAS